MTSRAVASIASQATPGRTARVAVSCAACSTPNRCRNSSSGPFAVVAAGDPQRPGDVAAVAAERAADVEDDRLARLDDPLGRLVVGRRGVRAGADDREVGLLVALGDEPVADLARDVGLGPADEATGGDLGDDPVGGLGGEPEQRDLVGVLRHPERPQGAASPTRSRPRAGLAGAAAGGCAHSRSETPSRSAPRARPGRGRSRPRGRADRRSRPTVTIGTSRAAAGAARQAPRAAERRGGSGRRPARSTSIVSRSSGIAS